MRERERDISAMRGTHRRVRVRVDGGLLARSALHGPVQRAVGDHHRLLERIEPSERRPEDVLNGVRRHRLQTHYGLNEYKEVNKKMQYLCEANGRFCERIRGWAAVIGGVETRAARKQYFIARKLHAQVRKFGMES